MASETISNGAAAEAPQTISAAERLRQKHEADATHRAMVEDVVDDEDIAHPPPSMHLTPQVESSSALPDPPAPMSEKSAGKQKARDGPPPAASVIGTTQGSNLNMQSEEAFPALGGGPKASAAAAPLTMAWGAKKPTSVHANVNGINGHAPLPSMNSSRASTPTSGILTPTSTNASIAPQPRGVSIPKQMAIPGRHSERIELASSQLLPRNQLKKPLQETLRALNKRSKANVEMKSGPNGTIIFEGTGPVDATRQALKDLAQEVGSKQTVKVAVPLSVRPHIIGRQGSTIHGISKRTGARVQMPKTEENPGLDFEDDDAAVVDVTIEGDAVSAEMAKREIDAIVNERTSTVNMRLRDVPAEFFPFIAGPRNSKVNALEDGRQVKIQVPHYHTWSDQPPPQPSSTGMPLFIPSTSNHIRISGDRLKAQEVRSDIDRRVQELRCHLTLSQIPIDRGRHQFVLDRGGESLHDLLEETGCSVILPPMSEDTEMLTVVGPPENIEMGTNKVMELAMSMQMSNVDFSRHVARNHTNPPLGADAHARALTQYLQRRKVVEELERQHNARIILPASPDGPTNWEIYSRDGANLIRARSDIMEIINAHPPSRLRHVEVDPFFHQHIHRQAARHIRDEYGVHLLTPDDSDGLSHMILVYEDTTRGDQEYRLPRQQTSSQEGSAFAPSLQQSQEHILSLIRGQEDIGGASIEVPAKYQDKVRKFVQRQQQSLPQTQIPVQISFVPGTSDCLLRGPSSAVETLSENLVAFIEAEKQDELERGHVTSFGFPQKHANFLIGKRGDNINKLREEFDVDIQVKEGRVDITGPKAKAEAAKTRILALSRKLEDEAVHVLKIKPQYHRDMIGPKGSQVNHLQNKYDVKINFPRTAHNEDDRSVADDASEAGGSPKHRRSNQPPDEVVVRGPRKGADNARDELLSFLQWLIDNSHTSDISVAQAQLPSLIGQGGREMESVRLETGAQIDVPGREGADPKGRVKIQLKGTKKQVDDARKVLEQKVKVFDDSITKAIKIDKKYHRALIGSGGSNIHDIVVNAGGSGDRRDLAKTVRFPSQDSEDDTIRVEGSKALVDKILAAIRDFANARESQVTEIMDVAPDKHRILIGRGGESRRALESQFNIGLDVPKLSVQGAERSRVRISGQAADIEKAKAHILELIKEQEGEALQVPRKHHHTVSDNGQFFRRLRNDLKVTVDHAGQQPPQRDAMESRAQANGTAAMPLITDDPSSIDNHHFEIVDSAQASEEGEIPWIMRGPPENVAKARALVEKAMTRANEQESQAKGYLILPDPKTYRFIIGQGGQQINAIRKQTGCRITVPKQQTAGTPIEIVGTRDSVEEAKDIMLDIVQNGGRRD